MRPRRAISRRTSKALAPAFSTGTAIVERVQRSSNSPTAPADNNPAQQALVEATFLGLSHSTVDGALDLLR
jgi:hypothetical protein